MSASEFQPPSSTPPSQPTLRGRVLRMVAVWTILGGVMGVSVGMESGGIVGAVAGMVAGIVEMTALGAIFGLIGGRPGETLLGAVCGTTVGMMAGLVGGDTPIVLGANFGLVVGAMVGATLRPYLRLVTLPIIVLADRVSPSFIGCRSHRRH